MDPVGWVIDTKGSKYERDHDNTTSNMYSKSDNTSASADGKHPNLNLETVGKHEASAQGRDIVREKGEGAPHQMHDKDNPVEKLLNRISREMMERRGKDHDEEMPHSERNRPNKKHRRKKSRWGGGRDSRGLSPEPTEGHRNIGQQGGSRSLEGHSSKRNTVMAQTMQQRDEKKAGGYKSGVGVEVDRDRGQGPERVPTLTRGTSRDPTGIQSAAEIDPFTGAMWDSVYCRQVLDAIFFGPGSAVPAGAGEQYKELEGGYGGP